VGPGETAGLAARWIHGAPAGAPGVAVRAGADLANAPMADAFARAGYTRFATRREFELPR
jgi:hypothetical protein